MFKGLFSKKQTPAVRKMAVDPQIEENYDNAIRSNDMSWEIKDFIKRIRRIAEKQRPCVIELSGKERDYVVGLLDDFCFGIFTMARYFSDGQLTLFATGGVSEWSEKPMTLHFVSSEGVESGGGYVSALSMIKPAQG